MIRAIAFLVVGSLLLVIGCLVISKAPNKPENGQITIILDQESSEIARVCLDEGFGVNIWTDSINSVTTCAEPWKSGAEK